MGSMSSEKKWTRRVGLWRSSGLTSTEFCRGRAFSAGGLRHWAYLLRRRGATVAVATQPTVRLVRIERTVASTAAAAPVAAGAATTRDAMTIELGAARLTVPAGFDPATLRAALGALVEQSGGVHR